MKKNYLTAINILLAIIAHAQITFQSTDLPLVNATLTGISDSVTTYSLPSTGANQVWDYSQMLNQKIDATKLLPYTVSGSVFSQATMVSKGLATATVSGGFSTGGFSIPSNAYIFTNSKGLYLNGISLAPSKISGYVTDTNLIFNPALAIMRTPITYNTIVLDSSKNVTTYSYFGYTLTSTSYYKTTFTGIGWGSLKTPEGTFQNTLLVKTHTISYAADDPSTVNTSTTYIWVQKSNQTPFLCSMSLNSSGTLCKEGTYYKNMGSSTTTTTGTTTAIEKSLSVNTKQYPIPSNNVLYIELPLKASKSELTIFRIDGALLEKRTFNEESILEINTSVYPAGTYLYQISTDQNVYSVSKFTVAH
jgi:hypothetical protein